MHGQKMMTSDSSNISDEVILSMIKDKHTKEMGCRYFMRQHQERIYWVIRKIVMTHEDTDDVIQNTFLKAFRALENFEGRSSLYTWLHRIAVNEALAYRKSQLSGGRIIPIDQHTKIEAGEFDQMSADTIRRKLDAAIELLPEKQKEVFSLRYFEEMSYQEMSEKLLTSIGALKASYHFAVKKIESFLENGTEQ
ncbi:MAG TPA: RNA polymerase sigma factor [Saprospiraceae bacterium]|nr:RNA polymerase sigma factor [Saprospiraceae bacterium]